MDAIEVHAAVEKEETLIDSLIIKIEEPATASQKGTFSITEVEVKIICFEGDRDRNSEGQGNSNRGRRWDSSRGQGHSDWGRGRRWNPSQQYQDPGYQQQT